MRRSTRRALADASLLRRRQARAIRSGLQRQRLAMLGRIRALGAPGHENDTEALRARVLDVLEAYPDGVDARAIGNELGVDWRRVTAVISGLVARGEADQIDQDFYPSGKASRRC